MITFIYLAVGGALGAIGRYLTSGITQQIIKIPLPFGTLVVNSIGCLIAGFLWSFSENKIMSPHLRIFLFLGFLGSYTTFSTLILETDELVIAGQFGYAIANISSNIFGGLLLFSIGSALGRAISTH